MLEVADILRLHGPAYRAKHFLLPSQHKVLAVLHTWTRTLLYHPHVHLLASAGGLSADEQQWVPAKNPAFLVPGRALSKIFKGKFKAGLRKLKLLDQVDRAVWQQKWNVQIQ